MRTVLLLALCLAASGCDIFGGGRTLDLTYTVDATGAFGPVSITYEDVDGPVTVETSSMPFTKRIQVSDPRPRTVYLIDATTTFTGPGTMRTEIDAAVDGSVFFDEDDINYTGDSTRTVTSASIVTVR